MFGNRKTVWNVRTVSMMVVSLLIAAGHARADFVFGEPINLGPTVNSGSEEAGPYVSADGLCLYFNSTRSGGYGNHDLWVTTRKTVLDPWGTPVNLGPTVNSSSNDGPASISANGLELYFSSHRSGGQGNLDLWVAKRETTSDPWGTPENLGPTVNSFWIDWSPSISSDGLTLYMHSFRPGGYGFDELWVTHRATSDDAWGQPVNLGSTVNSPDLDATPHISADDRILLFQSLRPGGYGHLDIWMTSTTAMGGKWTTPVNLGPIINGSTLDSSPCLSPDGAWLLFASNRGGGIGGTDLWQAPILPVVDFTGDYRVDIEDLLLLIENWGQNEPAYDIGPKPLGDGTVDVNDLEVLMSYWGQELYDPHFLAHLALDETVGSIAYDSVGENHATTSGAPTWQPEAGQIQGALALDGADDYVTTPSLLDPSGTVFSVFLWVQGSTPSQIILSQIEGANWLAVNESGCLYTDLKGQGRNSGQPLDTSTVITDGQWHRVGLVWDSQYRNLYVDDQLVATDTTPQNNFASCTGEFRLGADPALDSSTLWQGLIDDVRAYDRVVAP